jgi:hypothetical protein
MSLVNGVNMTPYSEETVSSYIIAAHEEIVKEHEWSEMTVWRQRTLDGATGKVTELITDTKDWKNIRRIYHEMYQTPVGLLSSYVNPLSSTLLFGYRGLPPEEDNISSSGRYLVMFYPNTISGKVMFNIDRSIDFTVDPDLLILPIDWWLHVYMASWMYACDDGTNPAQIDKYDKLSSKRMRQITSRESSRPSYMQPNQMIPNDWWESDAPYS